MTKNNILNELITTWQSRIDGNASSHGNENTLPNITASRSEPDLQAVVWNLSNGEKKLLLHQIDFYQINENGEFEFSHKYDLLELSQKYNVSYVNTYIRQLGDEVLHRAAQETTFSNDDRIRIDEQLKIMKKVLSLTGGVGIAANQCLEISSPLKLILAGVDYSNPEHVVKAVTRYPTTLFPQVKLYINPEIVNLSEENEFFSEGCLSVEGVLRASVKRPKSLTISYFDIGGKKLFATFTGSDARVMLHEIDHINYGTVYIQRIIKELNLNQLNDIKEIITSTQHTGRVDANNNNFSIPKTVFIRNESDEIIFDKKELTSELSKIPTNTLQGVLASIDSEISNRTLSIR